MEKLSKKIMQSEVEAEQVFSWHQSMHSKLRSQPSPEKMLSIQYIEKIGNILFLSFLEPVQMIENFRNLNLTILKKA